MGRVKDACPCLNVSAFFGGGTLALAVAQQQESDRKLEEILARSPSALFHRELLNELPSSMLQLRRGCFLRN